MSDRSVPTEADREAAPDAQGIGAMTVVCPICGSRPGQSCYSNGIMSSTHARRDVVARQKAVALAIAAAREEGRRAGIETASRECDRIAAPFARMARAFGVGKADHAQGGDLAALKAITAEECASAIRARLDAPPEKP